MIPFIRLHYVSIILQHKIKITKKYFGMVEAKQSHAGISWQECLLTYQIASGSAAVIAE